jgi:hypothetical protein
MHDGICRKPHTEVAEDSHQTCRGDGCMMRIGKNESSFAIQGSELVGNFRNGAEAEHDAGRQRRVLEGVDIIFAWCHALTFVARVNSSIIASRIANF